MWLKRLVRRWQLAGWLADAEKDGRTLIDIPHWLAPEVTALHWMRSVERAEAKWAARTAEVTPEEWGEAARRRPSDH